MVLNRWSPREWVSAHPLLADALLALGVLFVFFPAVWSSDLVRHDKPVTTAVLCVFGVLPIALRRRAPWVAVGLAVVAMTLTRVVGLPSLTESVSVLIVAYSVGALLPVRAAVAAVAVIAVAAAAVLLSYYPAHPVPWYTWVANGLMLLVCLLIGRTVYTRRAYMVALEERAQTAEANRESAARQAVLDERRRIARELHDVVAHHISVMGVLATGARRTLVRDPVAADEALATIESTGRATLREMRRLLDVLRADDDHPDAALQPQPGVAGLEALVAQVREAGLPVSLQVDGEPQALDPGIDLTVFRIVQEALTNALKHAGRATASVTVGFHPGRLTLRIEDDGRGQSSELSPVGHGLVGMRERVSLYGGSLRTGSRTGGGFAVAAEIPLDPVAEVSVR